MSKYARTQSNAAALKEQLENLFPGKWFFKNPNQRNLQTGFSEIDGSISRGITRKKISEWSGAASSGKNTVLRKIIANWCIAGLDIVYVDTANKLIPADWAFIERGISGSKLSNALSCGDPDELGLDKLDKPDKLDKADKLDSLGNLGHFWVVRNLTQKGHKQDALWVTEQLVRANLFDVVIFDTTENLPLSSRFFARLQRSLDSSKSALLILKDKSSSAPDVSYWGCHTHFNFSWSNPIAIEEGLNGIAALMPTISGSICRNGITNHYEVTFCAYATNRLFTHSQIPDRRIPKARTRIKK
jgi:hypothetical protein